MPKTSLSTATNKAISLATSFSPALESTTFSNPGLLGKHASFKVPQDLDTNPKKRRIFFEHIETLLSGYAGREYFGLLLIDPAQQECTRAWLKLARKVSRFPPVFIVDKDYSDLALKPLSMPERDFKMLDIRIKKDLRQDSQIKTSIKSNFSAQNSKALARKLYKHLKARVIDENSSAGSNGFVSIPDINQLSKTLATPGCHLINLSKGKHLLGFLIFFPDPKRQAGRLSEILSKAPHVSTGSKLIDKASYVEFTGVTHAGEIFSRLHGISIYDALSSKGRDLALSFGAESSIALCRVDPAPAAALAAHASRGWQRTGITQDFITPSGRIGKDELMLLDLNNGWKGRNEPLKPVAARKAPLGQELSALCNNSLYIGNRDRLKALLEHTQAGLYQIGNNQIAPETVEYKINPNGSRQIEYRAWNTSNDLLLVQETINPDRGDFVRASFYLSLILKSNTHRI